MVNRQKLVEENMNLVYFVIHRNFSRYRNDEDLIQVGMMGLCKAANSWDETKGTFSTFAITCIYNTICKEFRTRNRTKPTYSLDYNYSDSEDEPVTLGDILVGEVDVDWVDVNGFRDSLTENERLVVDMKLTGLTQTEIAKRLCISRQRVNYYLRQAKLKLEKNK